MKGISVKSVLLTGALVAFASVSARANTITPVALAFSPGVSITYGANLTSGELHAGDGFTIFDIGGFLGFGPIDAAWSATPVPSPFGSPFGPSLGPDAFLTNVHFTYTGPTVQVVLGTTPFSPFTVLTSATLTVTDSWVSKDHLLGSEFVVGDGGVGPSVSGTIIVPLAVPEAGSTMAFLGLGLLGVGMLRRKLLI